MKTKPTRYLTPEEVTALPEKQRIKLKPKKCPGCGKDCIATRGGFSSVFMGCPDWPRCSGKSALMTPEWRRLAKKRLDQCYQFINQMGGPEEAKHWLEIAFEAVETLGRTGKV